MIFVVEGVFISSLPEAKGKTPEFHQTLSGCDTPDSFLHKLGVLNFTLKGCENFIDVKTRCEPSTIILKKKKKKNNRHWDKVPIIPKKTQQTDLIFVLP